MNIPIKPVDMERVNTVKGCTEWLDHCRSECCKLFRINLGPVANGFRRGQVVKWRFALNEDQIKYFKYHGCTYEKGVLKIRLDKFSVKNGRVSFHRKCDLLNDKGLCDGHSDGRKPKLCEGLTIETIRNHQYIATPNCLYKYKRELSDGKA